jgi:hypothetical protein
LADRLSAAAKCVSALRFALRHIDHHEALMKARKALDVAEQAELGTGDVTAAATDAGAIVPSGNLLDEARAILNRAYDVLMSDAKGDALIDALDPVAYDIERIKPKIAAALTAQTAGDREAREAALLCGIRAPLWVLMAVRDAVNGADAVAERQKQAAHNAGVEPRRGSNVGSDPLLGVSDPCKTCSDRDKPDDEDPCAMCGPPAWEYHDSRCDDDVTPNARPDAGREKGSPS